MKRMAGWVLFVAAILLMLPLLVRWLEPRMAFFPFLGESETPRDYSVGYEPLTLTTKDGERLHAWLMHAPQPRARIVYFHGNGGNLSNWAPILAAIARRGYTVLAVDYRGYGLSTGRPSERGLYRDVDAVVGHVKGMDASPRLVYWGRSLGASMAAYAASIHAPDGVILEASFPSANAALRGSGLLAALAVFSTYRFPTSELMQKVAAPVLVLHGDRDSVIPFELGREVYDALPGPKTLVAIRGGDHNDASPADPGYWPAIDGFIGRLPR